MYDDADLAVLHNGKISAPFQTNTGIMSEVCRSNRGITWSLTRHLEDLDYADDICLLVHRFTVIQAKCSDLEARAKAVGLSINALQCSKNQSDADPPLSPKQDHHMREKCRISRKTKLRIFNACIKSVLLYGSETWLTSQRMVLKLQAFVNKCLRIICGIFWPNRITNDVALHKRSTNPAADKEEKMEMDWSCTKERYSQDGPGVEPARKQKSGTPQANLAPINSSRTR
ncbi:uncharacterized protein LOC123257365 [Drosophila ananassae]|uniref:uncharacterized protein LOC123257365 n=1 Tax=Drosophila ananassae TaxID=7217 RepID=UPI001CFF94B8|nr:uncharacterized protein LOC123257365 [Drosophila ananassae]